MTMIEEENCFILEASLLKFGVLIVDVRLWHCCPRSSLLLNYFQISGKLSTNS